MQNVLTSCKRHKYTPYVYLCTKGVWGRTELLADSPRYPCYAVSLRVSTDMQYESGLGIGDQKMCVHDFLRNRHPDGYCTVAELEEWRSGTTAGALGPLLTLFDLTVQCKGKGVVFARVDRMSRDPITYGKICEKAKLTKVEIIIADGTTADTMDIHSALSSHVHRTIVSSTKKAMAVRKNLGLITPKEVNRPALPAETIYRGALARKIKFQVERDLVRRDIATWREEGLTRNEIRERLPTGADGKMRSLNFIDACIREINYPERVVSVTSHTDPLVFYAANIAEASERMAGMNERIRKKRLIKLGKCLEDPAITFVGLGKDNRVSCDDVPEEMQIEARALYLASLEPEEAEVATYESIPYTGNETVSYAKRQRIQ